MNAKSLNQRPRGVTQCDIARATGMQQRTISRLESGLESPRLVNYIKYLAACGKALKVIKTRPRE